MILGFSAVGLIASGLMWICIGAEPLAGRRADRIGLGYLVWSLCLDAVVQLRPIANQASDNRNDDAPMVSMAAIRNHSGNAPRLIFTIMEPSV